MKNIAIYLKQVGLKSLGYDPGPVDGVDGPKTRAAEAKFVSDQVVNDSPATTPAASLQIIRWKAATLKPTKASQIKTIVDRILKNRGRYEVVSAKASVPWWVIAALHNMESGGDFTKHLHEGSPLTGRTKYVPKGRPLTGAPPFTWEESALDALKYDSLASVNWNSLDAALYAAERYNGLGYLKYHPETPSPYLWAGTSVEKPGKYTGDGEWSSTAVSAQIGVAAIWKSLETRGEVVLPAYT